MSETPKVYFKYSFKRPLKMLRRKLSELCSIFIRKQYVLVCGKTLSRYIDLLQITNLLHSVDKVKHYITFSFKKESNWVSDTVLDVIMYHSSQYIKSFLRFVMNSQNIVSHGIVFISFIDTYFQEKKALFRNLNRHFVPER